MRLVLLVDFSCRGEFIDGDKRFFGRKAIFPASMPGLSEERRKRREKGSGEKDKLRLGVFVSIPYAKHS